MTQSGHSTSIFIEYLIHLEDIEMATSSTNERLSLIANLGVLAGLVILILEVNQANKLAETQAYVGRLDQMQQARLSFAESEFLPDLDLKAANDGVQSLSEAERIRLREWYRSVLLRMESHYYYYEQGYLDAETGKIVLESAADTLEIWRELDVNFLDGRFKRLVEEAAAAR